jgi:hypothetical protein
MSGTGALENAIGVAVAIVVVVVVVVEAIIPVGIPLHLVVSLSEPVEHLAVWYSQVKPRIATR